MKAYLVVFNDNFYPTVNRQVISNFLDTKRLEIPNWYACFSHGILLNSDRSATDLADLIQVQFPQIWFAVTEINPTTINGWAPKQFWDFVNNPRPAGT